jgi:hypothetical protein
MIKRACGLRKEGIQEKEEHFITNSLIICILLPSNVRAIKMMSMRWLGHTVYMEEMKNEY